MFSLLASIRFPFAASSYVYIRPSECDGLLYVGRNTSVKTHVWEPSRFLYQPGYIGTGHRASQTVYDVTRASDYEMVNKAEYLEKAGYRLAILLDATLAR